MWNSKFETLGIILVESTETCLTVVCFAGTIQ